ncbi:MAG: PAS domain-containing protein [Planctomycetia bacterium]|nr:PAS domain-containing protein [Planctomycetia bacterium]
MEPKVEEALPHSSAANRQDESGFYQHLESSPVPAYICDRDGAIGYFNPAAAHIWGRQPRLRDARERYGGAVALFTADGQPLPRDLSCIARAIAGEYERASDEMVVERPDGSRVHVLSNVNVLRDARGQVRGALDILVDVSRYQPAARRIAAQERFARAVLDSLSDHIAVLDRDGNIVAVNDAWENFAADNDADGATRLGQGLNYLAACRAARSADDAFAERALAGIEAVLRRRQSSFLLEYPCHSPTEQRWFLMNVTPLYGDEGGAVVSHVNITERRLAHEARLRLVEQLLSAQEDERRRVALDLHDDIGQALTAVLLGLRATADLPLSDAARSRLQSLRDMAAGTLDAVRRLARGLRPSTLQDLGLSAALERFVADFEAAQQLRVQLELPGQAAPRLPERLEIALYRIVQEALTNVAKHARPTAIEVVLRRQADAVCLTIQDDGSGFAADDWRQQPDDGKHMGLSGIGERAALLGGRLEVQSAPGCGTTLIVSLPLAETRS